MNHVTFFSHAQQVSISLLAVTSELFFLETTARDLNEEGRRNQLQNRHFLGHALARKRRFSATIEFILRKDLFRRQQRQKFSFLFLNLLSLFHRFHQRACVYIMNTKNLARRAKRRKTICGDSNSEKSESIPRSDVTVVCCGRPRRRKRGKMRES